MGSRRQGRKTIANPPDCTKGDGIIEPGEGEFDIDNRPAIQFSQGKNRAFQLPREEKRVRTPLNKLSLSALAILTLSSWLAGQQKEKAMPPQEKHEVEVRLILVDVIATKGGEFFPGLKKADFKLYEDGKEVEINSCDLISLGKSDFKLIQEKEPITPYIAQKKRLAVLFDGVNAWDREFKKAAQQIADELVSLAKSDVEVMVLFLDNQKGLKIVQPFTDQEVLIRAAAAKSAGAAFSPFLEYLDYDDVLFAARKANEDLKSIGAPESVDLGPIYEMRTMEHTNSATDKLSRTIGGLLASLHMLESLPGRKNILFVSNGFPDLDTFKIDNLFPLRGRVGLFDPFGILGEKIFQTGDEVLKEIIRVANDRNISIYSFDPGTFSKNVFAGASAEYFDRETAASQKTLIDEKSRQVQNLKMISEKTGAALLRGANKIESLRQVVRNDLSYYYQLSYYPPRKKGGQEYHKIEVRVSGRNDIQIRSREGYSDVPIDAAKRLVLAKAFYNPELFVDKLPFRAEFIPLAIDSGKSQPWMNIALPGQEFFKERFAGYAKKSYEFHFWIRGESESDRVLAGNVAIPLDIEAIKNRLASMDFLRLHFSGPVIELPDREYRVVFALFDPETGEIGTWSSNFARPFLKGSKEGAIINGILGNGSLNQSTTSESFSLNSKDGALECGQIKFFPKITGQFSRTENVFIFFQVYYPQGGPIEAKFNLTDKNALLQKIEGAKVAESWNKNSKVWSGSFRLDFENTAPGDYVLKIEVPVPAGKPNLTKEVKLTLF